MQPKLFAPVFQQKKAWLLAFVFALGLTTLVVFNAMAALQPRVVVFTASWCAACREVVPQVQGLAKAQNLSVELIDVDDAEAATEAKGEGLSIPHKELPQVYLLGGKQPTLWVDGTGYKLGQATGLIPAWQAKLNAYLAGH